MTFSCWDIFILMFSCDLKWCLTYMKMIGIIYSKWPTNTQTFKHLSLLEYLVYKPCHYLHPHKPSPLQRFLACLWQGIKQKHILCFILLIYIYKSDHSKHPFLRYYVHKLFTYWPQMTFYFHPKRGLYSIRDIYITKRTSAQLSFLKICLKARNYKTITCMNILTCHHVYSANSFYQNQKPNLDM